MDQSNAPMIIKALEARKASMKSRYSEVEDIFEEIQDVMQPNRGRFSRRNERRRESGYNKRIIDTTAQRAHRTLVSGLMAGVTSPSRPWFRLGLHDRGAQEDYEVKQWLHTVQSLMYDVLRESNVYRMFHQCYSDLGSFGVFGGVMGDDFENVIHCYSFPVGSYHLACDDKSVVNSIHYSSKRTVGQLVKRFGKENVSNAVYNSFRNNDLHREVKINHVIEERFERDPMSPLATDMPMASFYWEEGERRKLLYEGGFGVNNIFAPRWNTIDTEVWPTEWPALLALGDATQLQVQHRDKAQAIQYSYKPPLMGPAGFVKRFRNVPGAVTSLNTNDLARGGLRPAVEVRPNVSDLVQDIRETQQRISSAFFEDLFLMTSLSDRRQVTATEIAERHEEKLLVLGPVLESLDYELLSKVISASFHFMQEADLIPEAPEALVGSAMKVEYVSLLAQAQKAVGVGAIERTLGFAGSLAQLSQDVLDNLDTDNMLREFTEQVGPPPNTLRSPSDVAKTREQRAQQQSQAQAIEAAQPLAQAANLISEANERGAAALQRGAPL